MINRERCEFFPTSKKKLEVKKKMCNTCSCENEVKCSVVGMVSIGFCCPMCVQYEETRECVKEKVGIKPAKSASISRIQLLTH
jgi:hypothetical protein